MVSVANQVLKGLLEGLVLLAIERDPTHGYGILKDFEELLGEAPNKNQVYPLLARLEEEGRIVSEEVVEDGRPKQVYQLTEEGREGLDEFRQVSPALKNRLVDLFAIPPRDELVHQLEEAGRVEELAHVEDEQGPRPPPRSSAPAPAEGWVREGLDRLPRGPAVQARYATISFERSPGRDQWLLKVDQHDPGRYDGADACPLTFLYLAAQRLLFEPGEE